MTEYHRIDEAKPSSEGRRKDERESGRQIAQEEDEAQRVDGGVKFGREIVDDQAVDDEPPCKGIDGEQGGERVDRRTTGGGKGRRSISGGAEIYLAR